MLLEKSFCIPKSYKFVTSVFSRLLYDFDLILLPTWCQRGDNGHYLPLGHQS